MAFPTSYLNNEVNLVPNDEEIARRSLDVQKRARDYSLMEIPGYMKWSEAKIAEGGNEAFLANLEAQSMWLLPEDLETVTTDIFDEMLEDVKMETGGLD